MKYRKIVALAMIAAMITAGGAGCKKSDSTNTTAESKERPKISFMTFDFDGSPMTGDTAQQIIDKMEEYTNTDVEFTWVPSDNYDDKLSLALASSTDMPMVIAAGGMTPAIISAAEAGAFWDLSKYIYDEQKYPNLSKANKEVNESITMKGQLLGVYRARDIGRNGMGYREDWAEKLGLGEPKTIEDVYNMMDQFTHGDPDGNGKDDTYGLCLCKYTGPFDIMQTWFGCGNGWVDQNGELIPVFQTAEYKEALTWFKKMYDDGLVYEDWAVRDTSTWQDGVKNGECGMYIDVLDGSRRIWDYFVNNNVPSVVDSSKTASMKMVGAINGHTLATSGYNGFFLITKSADTEEKLEACLHYLDKMCDDEMQTLAGYGLKDVHYKIDDKGYLIDTDSDDPTMAKNYGALNQTIAYINDGHSVTPAVELSDRQILEKQIKADNIQYAVFNPAASYLVNSATYSLSGSILDQLISDARTQYICGQIDDAGLQKIYDQWAEQGGTEVIKEVNEQYKAK